MNFRNNIYLIGFMGAGKTTVGQELASLMKRNFIDLDEAIVAEKGMEISDIFQEEGEETFRLWEKEVLFQCQGKGAVIATGGGIVEREENLPYMLSTGDVVYLEAPFQLLFSRIESDSSRPLTKEGEEALKERFERRQALYEQASTIVNTEDRTPAQIAHEIFKVISV